MACFIGVYFHRELHTGIYNRLQIHWSKWSTRPIIFDFHQLSGPSWSSSQHVRVFLCQSPSHAIFKASALWADAFYKSKCPSVCPSVRVSVCVSVCLFTFEVPCNGLFAPTSRSRMSNIFTDSESLGKSNGKKWSQI